MCTCTCTCMCVYVHIYVCVYLHLYIYVYMYIYEYIYMWVCVYVCVFVYVDMFIHCPNYEFIKGDITDIKVCETSCKDVDYVLHQAAWGSVPRSIEMPLYYEPDVLKSNQRRMTFEAATSGWLLFHTSALAFLEARSF